MTGSCNPTPALPPLRLLVIDDEPAVRTNLCAFLADDGFAVTAVASGEEALSLLARETFDVAIVDIRLPGQDGNSVIVRAQALQPLMRYLIHTGSVDYQIPTQLRHLGINAGDVLPKPVVDMHTMTRAILRLCGRTAP